MEIVTSWHTLFRLAREAAIAEKSGNKEEAQLAREAHKSYEKLCLEADRMIGINLRDYD